MEILWARAVAGPWRLAAQLALMGVGLGVGSPGMFGQTFANPGGETAIASRVHVVFPNGVTEVMVNLGEALVRAGNNCKVVVYGQHRVTPATGSYEGGISPAPLQWVGRTNVVLRGEAGAEIYGEGPGDFLNLEDCQNVVIDGITFRSNRPGVDREQPHLYSMILLRGSNSEITIARCRFQDFGNHAISHLFGPKTSTRVSVTACSFVRGGAVDVPGLGFDGAAVSGIGSYWRLTDNRVEECIRGFELENPGTNLVEGVEISGNTFREIVDLGVMLFSPIAAGENFSDLTITGNLFKDFRDRSGSATAIRLAGGRRILIARNVVENMARQGIALNSADGPISEVTMVNNLVSGAFNNGIVFKRAQYPVTGVSILDNRASRCGEAGIRVEGVEDALLAGNVCFNNAIHIAGGGIEVGDSRHPILRGNSCYDSGDPMTQNYGIWLKEDVRGAVLRNNVCLDTRAAVAGILDQSPDADAGGDKTSMGLVTVQGDRSFTFIMQETPFLKSIQATAGGQVTLTWFATPGMTYQVQSREGWSGVSWQDVGEVVEARSSAASLTLPVGMTTLRYFRVVELGRVDGNQ
jgi:hypothetical protein